MLQIESTDGSFTCQLVRINKLTMIRNILCHNERCEISAARQERSIERRSPKLLPRSLFQNSTLYSCKHYTSTVTKIETTVGVLFRNNSYFIGQFFS
jgi:hypothetical protein